MWNMNLSKDKEQSKSIKKRIAKFPDPNHLESLKWTISDWDRLLIQTITGQKVLLMDEKVKICHNKTEIIRKGI